MGLSWEVRPNIARLTNGDYPAPYPPEWNVIQPKELEMQYPAHIAGFVWRAVYEVDLRLQDSASHTEDGQLVVWKAPMRETQPAQNAILSVLHEHLKADDEVQVIGLLHGVTHGMSTLWNADDAPSYRRRIHAIRMNGYTGKLAVKARIYEEFSQNLSAASLIYIFDDVWDTGHEIGAVLYEIEKMRGLSTDSSIRDRLNETRNLAYGQFIALYDEVIGRMHTAGVVAAELFYKNKPFLDRLRSYAESLDKADPWRLAQESVLDAALLFDRHDWLMGEGLDTDIDGVRLYEALGGILPDELYYHPKVIEALDYLRGSKIRIGSHVEGLIALNRTSKDDLIAFTALHFKQAIVEWARVGFRWERMYEPQQPHVLDPILNA